MTERLLLFFLLTEFPLYPSDQLSYAKHPDL